MDRAVFKGGGGGGGGEGHLPPLVSFSPPLASVGCSTSHKPPPPPLFCPYPKFAPPPPPWKNFCIQPWWTTHPWENTGGHLCTVSGLPLIQPSSTPPKVSLPAPPCFCGSVICMMSAICCLSVRAGLRRGEPVWARERGVVEVLLRRFFAEVISVSENKEYQYISVSGHR